MAFVTCGDNVDLIVWRVALLCLILGVTMWNVFYKGWFFSVRCIHLCTLNCELQAVNNARAAILEPPRPPLGAAGVVLGPLLKAGVCGIWSS